MKIKEIEKIEEIEDIKDINNIKSKQIDKYNKRENIWDIVKAVGIISIVIGHVVPIVSWVKFVYTYHLIIFYFIAGYFYKEEKYGDKPFEYFCNTLKKNWTKYMFWSILIIIFHNFFIQNNFYFNIPKYNCIDDYIVAITNASILKNTELFAGALWFVPTLILASGLFALTIYIARKMSVEVQKRIKNIQNDNIKYIIITMISIIVGTLGVYLNENKTELEYAFHTSLLVLPIYTMAYFYKIFISEIKKIDKWYIWIILLILSTMFLCFMVSNNEVLIELSDEKIINGPMFYIVSIIGICFCISISKIIEKIPVINEDFITIGKHSFSIMALHFACIKGVDVIYSKLINQTNPQIISKWVSSYPQKLWVIYTIVGVMIPTLISITLHKFKNSIKK